MSTRTKEQDTETKRVYILHATGPDGSSSWQFPNDLAGGHHRIDYADGPKRGYDGRLIWKPCVHSWTNTGSRYLGFGKGKDYWGSMMEAYYYIYDSIKKPKAEFWDQGVVIDCLRQLDLNCTNSVMAYSGIIQAIPFFGGVIKLNSILRKLAREMPKKWRKRPFTETIKWAISADFIDRFVISPTIADAQMFHHACDYVINVLETMKARNAAPFALKAERVRTLSEVKDTFTVNVPYTGNIYGDRIRRTTVTDKAFLYLTANYDEAAVSPIQLWATRTGFTRPLDSAWDMVPFSFVFDYFARAGDFIEGLSSELASQEGLRAKIGEIHSLWGSTKTETKHTYIPKGINAAWYWYVSSRAYSTESLSSGIYQRFPINQPGTFINLLGSESEGFLDVQLSRTRVRTLAELFAQAKLPRG